MAIPEQIILQMDKIQHKDILHTKSLLQEWSAIRYFLYVYIFILELSQHAIVSRILRARRKTAQVWLQ